MVPFRRYSRKKHEINAILVHLEIVHKKVRRGCEFQAIGPVIPNDRGPYVDSLRLRTINSFLPTERTFRREESLATRLHNSAKYREPSRGVTYTSVHSLKVTRSGTRSQ